MKTSYSGLGDIGKQPTLENTVYENTVDQINQTLKNDELKNTFYVDPAKSAHIFGNRKGHLVDTPKNRETLLRVANDEKFCVGKDAWGKTWYVEHLRDGGQHWVNVYNGKIQDGGYNRIPKPWDEKTGLSSPIIPTVPKRKK